MSSPSKTLLQMEDSLFSVIESLIDSQHCFQTIGDELKDENLRLHFLSESLTRAQFRGDLETVLHQEGVHDIKEHGTANGTALRLWAELKSKLGGGDHTLLETAEQAEQASLSAYDDALSTELPFPVRQLLFKQSLHVQNSHDFANAALGRKE